jgi:DNA repair protein RecO (recombination protein O)
VADQKERRVRALVLDKTKLAETDLILTLLLEDGAQARAVAKGARKPGSRLAPMAELASELDVVLRQGRSLDLVKEAQLVDAHAGLRGEYERLSAAACVLELCHKTSYENDHNAFAYPLASHVLTALEHTPADDVAHLYLLVAGATLKLMSLHGWRPELAECQACGDAAPTYFSSVAGGALCESCVRDVAGARDVGAEGLGWLAALIGLPFNEIAALAATVSEAAWALELAHEWAAVQVESRFASFETWGHLHA